MSKQGKALQRLCAHPLPANFKWKDLKSLLESLGYKMLKNDGSRRKFYHSEKNLLIICHEPHPSSDVDKGCVVDVADHLKINGFVEE